MRAPYTVETEGAASETGYSSRDFNQIAAELRGIVRSAAGCQNHQPGLPAVDQRLEFLDPAQFRSEGAGERFRLLADLIEHAGHQRQFIIETAEV